MQSSIGAMDYTHGVQTEIISIPGVSLPTHFFSFW